MWNLVLKTTDGDIIIAMLEDVKQSSEKLIKLSLEAQMQGYLVLDKEKEEFFSIEKDTVEIAKIKKKDYQVLISPFGLPHYCESMTLVRV